MKKVLLISLAGVLTASVITGAAPAAAPQAAPAPVPAPSPTPQLTKQQSDFFESKIRPIFASACYKCHSVEEKKAKGKLVLDSREGWQKGGENGPPIVAGDPSKSLLIKAVSYTDPDLQMPPEGAKLSDKQ